MFTDLLSRVADQFDASPWNGTTGRRAVAMKPGPKPLYTQDQRRRRDESPWTLVQGVLAPLQFAVFLISLALVCRFLWTGEGESVATASVVIKTGMLYTIMITGAVWEREVFGRYLFAPAFYWEDMFSMVVIALHTAYIAALLTGTLDTHALMVLALSAYAAYLINAVQFILKLRAARKAPAAWAGSMNGLAS